MRNVFYSISINSSAWTDTNASSTLAKVNISNYKEFDITVQLSGSHGLKYNIYTAPVNEAEFFISETGATLTSGIHSANVHHFTNNNQNWLLILGSATEVNSASTINLMLTSFSEEI